MWYRSLVEAQEACFWKEVQYGKKFSVLKDSEQENCYWAQREVKCVEDKPK